MKTYLVAFLLSALTALVLTPAVRRFAPSVGAVDLPSGRRVNRRVIPRLGGLAILAGFLLPLLGLFFWNNRAANLLTSDLARAMALLLGANAMAAMGAADDLRPVRPLVKLFVQIAVAAAAYFCGFQMDNVTLPFVGNLDMGIFGLPVTVFWIVGIVNAVNLIDGLDGLAAGVAFLVCVVNFVVGLLSGNVLFSLFAASLGGALLGFLFFNFNPATIFMGDSGSMFIGFVLAVSSLKGGKGSTAVALLVPVLAMGLPIMDTLLSIVRRVIERRPVFSPDRGHIHHRLVDMGVTHRRAVMILYGISLLFTGVAILVYVGRDWQVGVALILATIVIFGTVRSLGRVRGTSQIGRSQAAYPEAVDRIRRAMPSCITGLADAKNTDDIKGVLAEFGKNATFVVISCNCLAAGTSAEWPWESENAKNGAQRGYVNASFKIQRAADAGSIDFGWYSDSGTASPQARILLQVVADCIAAFLENPELSSASNDPAN